MTLIVSATPHSGGCEFVEIDGYHGIVESVVFGRLGRRPFSLHDNSGES